MNMLATIIPKSDQMNADDLIGGPKTVTVTKVHILGEEQPVAVFFEGDGGKPFKPCKTCRRIMVHVWGPDAAKYTGRSMTLYRDDAVMFGGAKVGGIRISHMSHIEQPVTLALTASRANRRPFTVQPLRIASKAASDPEFDVAAFVATVEAKCADDLVTADQLRAWANSESILADLKKVAAADADQRTRCRTLIADRLGMLEAGADV